ncbi:hypothetical protein [Sporosarcina sp. Marseille-Q4943]|uniref:hypothetical protein n=1 Tax=Sporosarcina sp. Marseille-Q4943 TaxID=2942204 RepID=UPI00208DC804|nr:hypothetical protein [Sporosarcina sp. Marseille-Q4943]
MKTRMNQKGYALLIVLFLIVFIMTVIAIFMRGSISTAKQEQIVDSNNMAIVAAEMGMDYYVNYIGNEEKKIFQAVQSDVLSKVVCNNVGKPEGCVELSLIQTAARQKYFGDFQAMANAVKEQIHILNSDESETNLSNIYFTSPLLKMLSSGADGFLLLKMDIEGVSPTKEEILTATLKYTLPEIIVEETDINIPSIKPDPIKNPAAVFDTFVPVNAISTDPCSKEGKGDCDGKGGIYSTSVDLINYTNPNSMNNFIWFHRGELDAKNNINNLNAKVILESLEFKNNINNLYGSLVLLGKENNAGKIKYDNNASINTANDGKICINLDGYNEKDLKELEIKGNLIYYSNMYNAIWPGKGSQGTRFPGSFSEFIQHCTGLSPLNSDGDSDLENGNLNLIYFERERIDVDLTVDYEK